MGNSICGGADAVPPGDAMLDACLGEPRVDHAGINCTGPGELVLCLQSDVSFHDHAHFSI